jgi:hypothetical protein
LTLEVISQHASKTKPVVATLDCLPFVNCLIESSICVGKESQFDDRFDSLRGTMRLLVQYDAAPQQKLLKSLDKE